MKTRKVALTLPAHIAEEVERALRLPLSDAVVSIVSQWYKDERRTTVPLKKLRIGWPVDWYQAMLKSWGQNAIANNVRRILFADILRKNPDAVNYSELREHLPVRVSRKVKPTRNRNDHLAYLNVPEEWVTMWREVLDERSVTTYIKAKVFLELYDMSVWPKGVTPSEPQRLRKMVDLLPIW